jgi:hypothetical protein
VVQWEPPGITKTAGANGEPAEDEEEESWADMGENRGGGCGATDRGRCNDIPGGWMDKGNEYVGKRVRRCLNEEEKIVGFADGQIVGWLPAEKADYVSDNLHAPGALWRVRFDDEDMGVEDLEDFEVRDAIDSLERDEWADMGEKRGGGCVGAASHIQRSFSREGGGRVGADGEARGGTSVQGGDLQVC